MIDGCGSDCQQSAVAVIGEMAARDRQRRWLTVNGRRRRLTAVADGDSRQSMAATDGRRWRSMVGGANLPSTAAIDGRR